MDHIRVVAVVALTTASDMPWEAPRVRGCLIRTVFALNSVWTYLWGAPEGGIPVSLESLGLLPKGYPASVVHTADGRKGCSTYGYRTPGKYHPQYKAYSQPLVIRISRRDFEGSTIGPPTP